MSKQIDLLKSFAEDFTKALGVQCKLIGESGMYAMAQVGESGSVATLTQHYDSKTLSKVCIDYLEALRVQKSKTIDAAVLAGFMAFGMRDTDYQRALGMYEEGGALEMKTNLVKFVPYLQSLISAAEPLVPSFPGVIEYEVADEFGKMFIDTILNGGDVSDQACKNWLLEACINFFSQGASNEEIAEIVSTLNAVPQ